MFMMRTEVFIFSVCMVEVSQKKVYIVHRVCYVSKKKKNFEGHTVKEMQASACVSVYVVFCD